MVRKELDGEARPLGMRAGKGLVALSYHGRPLVHLGAFWWFECLLASKSMGGADSFKL